MDNSERHHIMMVYYYQNLSSVLEEKIFKVRFLTQNESMSEFERKLRLKQLEVKDSIEYHQKIFWENCVDLLDFDEPSKDEIFEYMTLFRKRTKTKIVSE